MLYIGQRKRRTKGERGCRWWKRLHHQLAPILIALRYVCARNYTSVSLRHPFLSAVSLDLSSADEEDRRCHVQVWECIRRERNKYKHSRFCAVRMHTYASIHVHIHTEHKHVCKNSVTGAGRVGCSTALKPCVIIHMGLQRILMLMEQEPGAAIHKS